MRAGKIDANHSLIREALIAHGWRVKSTASLPGWVDLVAQRGERTVLIEVKSPRGTPTASQIALKSAGWEIVTLRDLADVTTLSRRMR